MSRLPVAVDQRLCLSSGSIPMQINTENAKIKSVVSRAYVDTSVSNHVRDDDTFPVWAKAVTGAGATLIGGAGLFFGGRYLAKLLTLAAEERVFQVSVFPDPTLGIQPPVWES
ncbi:hypothetical protein OC845_003129 [Tilletia horrida]|nr:hypothetical protein OC845_003129 [Tilletia horrida]